MSATSLAVYPSHPTHFADRLLKHLLSPVFLAACLAVRLSPQEATYFALPGPGSASLVLSDQDHVACIIDGGQGQGRGIAAATLSGTPVLDALRARGVTNLVIVCSHPHWDHQGGLLELAKFPETLSSFDVILFIDSAYPTPGRLRDVFAAALAAHSKDGPKPVLLYRDASRGNAFDDLPFATRLVEFSNFVYVPPPTTSVHGHAVVMQYVLRLQGQDLHVVDFDDSLPSIVSSWVANNGKADVLVIPHHCADTQPIDHLLDVSAKWCVITVNESNQYRHPGLKNLLALLRRFGADSVWLTGSSDDVVLTLENLSSVAGKESCVGRIQLFAHSSLFQLDERITVLKNQITGGGDQPANDRLKEELGRLESDQLLLREISALAVSPLEGIAREAGTLFGSFFDSYAILLECADKADRESAEMADRLVLFQRLLGCLGNLLFSTQMTKHIDSFITSSGVSPDEFSAFIHLALRSDCLDARTATVMHEFLDLMGPRLRESPSSTVNQLLLSHATRLGACRDLATTTLPSFTYERIAPWFSSAVGTTGCLTPLTMLRELARVLPPPPRPLLLPR